MSVEVSPDNDDPGLPRPGELLGGKFRIERLVGRGGMGAVFAARHELLGQRVAVKMLLSHVVTNKEAVARFLNEARAAARIEGEHVARVMDVAALDDGRPYMVIEYLEGADLGQLIESRGPLPVVETVDYVLQALEALAQAHALGIVHRDFKPSNLFLARRSDGTTLVKVLDFGIAKATQPLTVLEQAAMTRSNSVLGSPQYMAPEQLRNAKSVDVRADIWSVGLTLYELLSGLPPFSGTTFGELFAAILEQPPPPLRRLRPEVHADLEALVERCLRRDPAERFQNVADLARALSPHGSPRAAFSVERIISWLPPPAIPSPAPPPPRDGEIRVRPEAGADRRGDTLLGAAKTEPLGAAVPIPAKSELRRAADRVGGGLGPARAEATAPPLSSTRSPSVPRRRTTIITAALAVVVVVGGAATALLRAGGSNGTAGPGLVSSPTALSIGAGPSAPAAVVSLAPTTSQAPEPSHRAGLAGLAGQVPLEASAALAAPPGTPPASSLAPAPWASATGRSPIASSAPGADASAPRSRTRADQTGLAGENPF
ncbi:MAG TPA: protein kinase [Polyangiaceae bacterium]|nr:protein kinase [Polyangiaceae bacterium]